MPYAGLLATVLSLCAAPPASAQDPRTAEAVALANAHINANRAQFGLSTDAPPPEVESAAYIGHFGIGYDAWVNYREQVRDGLLVVYSSIRIEVDLRQRRVFRSNGRHYQGPLPSLAPGITAQRARALVVGIELYNSGFAGPCCPWTVTEEDVLQDPVLVLMPQERDGQTRLVLAWQVDVRELLGWRVFVDAASGRILDKHRLYLG